MGLLTHCPLGWINFPRKSRVSFKYKSTNAPILLPIYGHRYMPVSSVDNPPVISVHGIDIIYYGQDLEDYFEVEFGAKEQEAICFENIQPISFWTDII